MPILKQSQSYGFIHIRFFTIKVIVKLIILLIIFTETVNYHSV